MGLGNKLIVSATGFPGTNKTWRFIQDAFREPLGALAKLTGDLTIITGVVNTAGVVSDGFISYNGEIIPFVGGNHANTVTVIQVIENANYNIDANDDTILDSLPAYRTMYATCGTGGIDVFSFVDLVRLKTIKELSELPPNALTFLRKGTIDITGVAFNTTLDVAFPNIGTANYMVKPSIQQVDNDVNFTDIRVTTANHTATGFKLIIFTDGFVPSQQCFCNYIILPL